MVAHLHCAIYETHAAFVELEKPWRALAERAPEVSLFSSWEWQSTWWKHYGQAWKPSIITVWNGEILVGMLPMYLAPSEPVPGVAGVEARLIASGGDTSPDYLGALVAPEREQEINHLLVSALLSDTCKWDMLRFTDMAGGNFSETLAPSLRSEVAAAEAGPTERIRIVRLPSSWEAYLGSLKRERRYRTRRMRTLAQSQIGAAFCVYATPEELRRMFPELIRLHRKRWNDKDKEGSFRTAQYIDFHTEVVERCAANGWARLYSLEVPAEDAPLGRRPIAMLYCYRYRDEVLFLQSGFDPDYERHSPGHVLMGFAIESALGEGARVFDMLKGDHAYKGMWSNDSRTTSQIMAHRSTTAGLLSLGRRLVGRLARRVLSR